MGPNVIRSATIRTVTLEIGGQRTHNLGPQLTRHCSNEYCVRVVYYYQIEILIQLTERDIKRSPPRRCLSVRNAITAKSVNRLL